MGHIWDNDGPQVGLLNVGQFSPIVKAHKLLMESFRFKEVLGVRRLLLGLTSVRSPRIVY
jgi:hypothetical protein